MVENPVIQLIWNNTKWLYTVLFEFKWFYIDLWSFVHLWSGALIFTLLTVYNVKRRWLTLFLILAAYEAIENPILVVVMQVFKPEKTVDVLTDILVGMIGGLFIYLLFNRKSSKKFALCVGAAFSSVTIAFVWAGWYGSIYLGSKYLDLPSFFYSAIWGGVMIFLVQFFRNRGGYLKEKRALFVTIAILPVLYLTALPVAAVTSTQMSHLKEGITGQVYFFYAVAPFLFIGLFKLFSYFFTKYQYVQNQQL